MRIPLGHSWRIGRSLLCLSVQRLQQEQTLISFTYRLKSHAVPTLAPTAPVIWGSNKKHRKVKLNFPLGMNDPKIEVELAPLRARVKEQVSFLYTIRLHIFTKILFFFFSFNILLFSFFY